VVNAVNATCYASRRLRAAYAAARRLQGAGATVTLSVYVPSTGSNEDTISEALAISAQLSNVTAAVQDSSSALFTSLAAFASASGVTLSQIVAQQPDGGPAAPTPSPVPQSGNDSKNDNNVALGVGLGVGLGGGLILIGIAVYFFMYHGSTKKPVSAHSSSDSPAVTSPAGNTAAEGFNIANPMRAM